MGTQVGNATPVDVAAAASDERIEDSGGETTSIGESSWTEEGGHEY
jgi:hypothetical protein